MANSRTLVNNIKRELKKQSMNYASLAIRLDVAESTIKKMFAKGNFSLDRLDQICDVLGVDLLEMVENVNEEVTRISKFTIGQEKILIKDFRLLLIAYAAINFWSVDDILYRYEMDIEEVMKHLKVLEGFGMLQIRENNRIRPLISNHFEWLPDGPLAEFFHTHFLPEFFKHDFKEAGAMRVIRYGDLTDNSKKILERKCMELVDVYQKLTYEDRHFKPGNRERRNTTLVVAFRSWTMSPWQSFAKAKPR
jgi:transcriptional regulator with XRE-family HTH domain